MEVATLGLILMSIVGVGLAMLIMAVGAMVSGRCLGGSCGGPDVVGPDGTPLSCETCPLRDRALRDDQARRPAAREHPLGHAAEGAER